MGETPRRADGQGLILPAGVSNGRQAAELLLRSQKRRNARREKRPYAANSRALDSADIHSPFRLLMKQIKLCICINAGNILPEMYAHLHMEIQLEERNQSDIENRKSLDCPRGNCRLHPSFLGKTEIVSG